MHMQVAKAAQVPRRVGLADLHREVINVLRKYGAHAVAHRTLEELWRPTEDKLERVKRFPWLQLLLVKWALQDRRVNLAFGPQQHAYTAEVHRQLVEKLWNYDHRYPQERGGAIWRMLRRTMNVQFDFQRSMNWGFMRWPALISRLPRNHGARVMFAEVMGMQPETFADLAMVVLSTVHDDRRFLPAGDLVPLAQHYGGDLQHFLDLFARNLGELRDEMQADPALRHRGAEELHEFPYLQRFPLLASAGGQLQVWHPLVFARGLENAVHLRLSAKEQAYTDKYSKVFEAYVTELATRACPQGITEQQYRDLCGPLGKAVEVAIPLGGCALFIEAKLSLFHDDVILEDDPKLLSHKTKRVRDAIEQGLGVVHQVHQPESPLHARFAEAAQSFLIVVTSRDLMLIGGESMQRLMPDTPLYPPGSPAAHRLPLSHVFIIDIADYEVVMNAAAEGKLDLEGLLQRASAANADVVNGRVRLTDHIDWAGLQFPEIALLSEASAQARARVVAALGGVPPAQLAT